MATARELLEQADALMRRNRLRDADAADASAGIPVLTEIVRSAGAGDDGERAADSGGERRFAPDVTAAMAAAAPMAGTPTGSHDRGYEFDDVPVLTEVIADLEPISIFGAPADAGEPSPWPEVTAGDASTDRSAVAVLADAPMGALEDASGQSPAAIEPDEVRGLAPPSPVLPGVTEVAARPRGDGSIDSDADATRWKALAEDVRMQVLQRIDIFTDTGLQERLTARLQPIVDRASADLVATINQHVGQLLREYVAEAIEREIEKWRRDGA